MRHFVIRTLAVLALLFGGWTYATPFTFELTEPSNPALPTMTYATVTGEVDANDDTLFHFRVELASGLKDFLNGGDRFGIVGFWFNSDVTLSPSMFVDFDPAGPWQINASNPNCPGGCRRGSGFGEFDNNLLWRGALEDRPAELQFDIDFPSPVTEFDFELLSVPKLNSINIGQFAIFIDGFDTTMGGVRVRGTFVKD